MHLNPLEIAHRGRAPTHQGHTIVEREVPKPSKLHQGQHLTRQGPTNVEREVPRLPRLRPAARILHGGPSPTLLSPTINERGVLGPSKLRPATHISLRGRYPTPQSPPIIERGNPGPSRLQPAAHDTTPAAAQQEPGQHPSTQGVDFSQDAIEPNNPFTRQYIDRLEAEIKQSEARVAKEQRILQKHLRHREEADKHQHGPCPGIWPSEPTFPLSDNAFRTSKLSTEASNFSHDSLPSLASSKLYSSRPPHNIGKRTSRRQNGAILRSTRARVDTHTRHNERAGRLGTAFLQRRMLDGFMLILTLELCPVSDPRLTGPEELFIDNPGVDGIRFIRSFDFSMVEGVFCFLM